MTAGANPGSHRQNHGRKVIGDFILGTIWSVWRFRSPIAQYMGEYLCVFPQHEALVRSFSFPQRFLNLTRVYCRSAHAAVICFHPLDRESWGRARLWAQDLVDAEPSCALYLVATRADQWLEDAALFKFRSTIAESDSSSVISGRNPGHYR